MIETLVQDVCVMMNVTYTKEIKFEQRKTENINKYKFKCKNIDLENNRHIQEQITIDDIILGN